MDNLTVSEDELASWFYSLDIHDRLRLVQLHDPRLLDTLLQQFKSRTHRTHRLHAALGSLHLVYDDRELIGIQSAHPYADAECTPDEVALMAALRFSYNVLQERFDSVTVHPSLLSPRARPTFIHTICASSLLAPPTPVLAPSDPSASGNAIINSAGWQPLRYVMVVRAIASMMHRSICRAFAQGLGEAQGEGGSGSSGEDDWLNERLSELLERAVGEERRKGTLGHILARLGAQFCAGMEHKVLPRWESEFMGTVVPQATTRWTSRRWMCGCYGAWEMFSFGLVDSPENALKVAFLKSVFFCYSGPLPSTERRERPRSSFFVPDDTLQRLQPQLIGVLDLSIPAAAHPHRRTASFSSPSPLAPTPNGNLADENGGGAGGGNGADIPRSGSTSPALFDESSQFSSEAASSYSARSDGSDTDSGFNGGGGGGGGFRETDFFAAPPSRRPFSKNEMQGFGFLKTSGNSSSEASPSSSTLASDAPSDSEDYSSGTATPDILAGASSDASSTSPGVSPQSSPRFAKRHAQQQPRPAAELSLNGDRRSLGTSFSAQKDPSLNGYMGSAGFYKCDAAADLPDWCTGRYKGDPSGFLSCEISDYVAYMDSLFRDEKHVYENAIRRITAAIERHLPGANLCTFGSYATGLCIPSSDLDLVCCIPEENIQRPFRLLSRALRDEPWVEQIKAIETAAFPVIKLISRDDGIPIDISFDCKPLVIAQQQPPSQQFTFSFGRKSMVAAATATTAAPGNVFFRSRHRGIQAAELVSRFLRTTPKLRPLVIVLKQFLFEQELNKPFTGGLGSFCLLVMVKAFLNIYDKDGTVLDTGGALTAFLRCYGVDFDYAKMGISLKHGGTHFNIGDPGYCKYMGAALTIEDPFDPMNNIGASSFNMIKVKQAFAEAFYNLTGKNNSGAPTILSRIMQL